MAIFSLLVLWKQREWFANLAGTSEKEPSLPAWSRVLLCLVMAPYGVIYLRQAMSPEMSPDAMAYHLGLVNLWVHAGRIYKIGPMFAAIPHGMEMLYLSAFTIGRHSAAALSAVVLAAIYLLQIWRQTHSSGTLIVAIAVAWELRKSGRRATRALFALLLAMPVFPGPYLIRNWI